MFNYKLEYIPSIGNVSLAAHVYQPTAYSGQSLPAMLSIDRYNHRRNREAGEIAVDYDLVIQAAKLAADHNIVLIVVDVRGSGASTGVWNGPFTDLEIMDAETVVSWIVHQPWSNQSVYMFGRSYRGIIQYLSLKNQHQAIKSIMPEMAMFDLYSFCRPGGIYRKYFAKDWEAQINSLDRTPTNGQLTEDFVLSEGKGCVELDQMFSPLEFRDDAALHGTVKPFIDMNPARVSRHFTKSNVRVKIVSGWLDAWAKDALQWFGTARDSSDVKLVIGPWSHGGGQDATLLSSRIEWVEAARQSKSIEYYVMRSSKSSPWKVAHTWPLDEQIWFPLYLDSSRLESGIGILPDSLALDTKFMTTHSVQAFVVDHAASTGTATRWANTLGGPFEYPNMMYLGKHGLSFTSKPLLHDIEVTGHPVFRVYAETASPDMDILAYMICVDNTGFSEYVTEGMLRASHRRLGESEYENFDLPYATHLRGDRLPVKNRIVRLEFDLHPTSLELKRGERIQVVLTGADADNVETLYIGQHHEIAIHTGGEYPSHLALPIVGTPPSFE